MNSKMKKTVVTATILSILAITILVGVVAVLYFAFQTVFSNDHKKDESELNSQNIHSLRYAPDGKHLYVVGESIDENDSVFFTLYQTSLDLKLAKKIKNNVEEVQPSPTGKYLLLSADKLCVINAMTGKTINTFQKPIYGAQNYLSQSYHERISANNWYKNDYNFWFTDGDLVVNMHNLKTKETKKLVNGYGLCWSHDGRNLLYVPGYDRKLTTKLAIYDYKNGTSKVIVDEPLSSIENEIFKKEDKYAEDIFENRMSVYIENATFSKDDKSVFYSIIRKKEAVGKGFSNITKVKQISLDGRIKRELWSKTIDKQNVNPENTVDIRRLMLTPDGNTLLFHSVDHSASSYLLIRLDIAKAKEREKIPFPSSGEWDYDVNKNNLIWYNGKIVEKSFD